jgi:HK97 family phage major capsid protein
MQRDENRVLREERGRIVTEMKKLSDNGVKTNDDRAAFGRLDAEAKRLTERIEMIERADDMYQEQRASGHPPSGRVGDIVGSTERHDQEYKKAFDRYLRRGRGELSMEDRSILRMETRDMSEGALGGAYPGSTSTSGGFFVPVGFVDDIEVALKDYGPLLREDVVTILPTDTGQPLPYPTTNDTNVLAQLIGEGQQVTEADANVGMIMFGAWKFSSGLVKVSLELLEDSRFDFGGFLVQRFAERFGRGLNSFFTTGTGTSQPMGIVTAVVASGPMTTAVGSLANDGTGGADTIGSDDLVNLEHTVDPLYRPGAKFMMHDQTLRAIKHIKDKYGRPLWMPAMGEKAPATIMGYEYVTNPYMTPIQSTISSPAVTATTVLFGQLKKFTVRRVRQMSVLRLSERFADFGQVAFLAFARYDSQLLDAGTHPVGALQNVA